MIQLKKIISTAISLKTEKRPSLSIFPTEHMHPVYFGTIDSQLKDDNSGEYKTERLVLEGTIYCPFKYQSHINESTILEAKNAYVDWLVAINLIPDSLEAEQKQQVKIFLDLQHIQHLSSKILLLH